MASSYPVLYSFRRCPYAMRARMALTQAGIVCELREVLLKDKPSSMLAISAKATVPVLQLPSGEVIDESLQVMVWALHQRDPAAWLAVQPEQTAELIAINDGKFKYYLDRYKYFQHYPEHPQPYYRECGGDVFLAGLEARLEAHNAQALMADRISLADVAVFPFVRQFAQVDREWFDRTYPLLAQWVKAFEHSRLFGAIMAKHKPWQQGDSRILTPVLTV